MLFSSTQLPQLRTAESEPWHLKHTRRVRRHLHMISTSNYEKCTCSDLPYRKATEVLCNRVAAQVQDETTALATRPDLTVRPAVENISEVCNSLLYRLRTQVVTICARLAMTFNHVSFGRDRSSTYHTKRKQESNAQDNSISPALTQRRGSRADRSSTASHDEDRSKIRVFDFDQFPACDEERLNQLSGTMGQRVIYMYKYPHPF